MGIIVIMLALAAPVLAYGSRTLEQGRQIFKLGAIRRALNLTEDQIGSLKAIREANKPQREAIRAELRQKAQTLRSVMSQANPNPTDVGNAMLALKEVRGRAQQLREQAMNSFSSSLTAEQLKTVEDLKNRRLRRNRN
jgi:Spy/CpxP family protein refolding chaperone